MEQFIKLNNQTAFRDKLARLLQFSSRMVWDITEKHSLIRKESVESLKLLDYHLAMFRRLLRLGRCIDTLYSALPILHHSDKVIQTLAVLTKISQALYLFCDHIIWFGRVGLTEVNSTYWARSANKYLFYSFVLMLMRDIYELLQIYDISKQSFRKVPISQLVCNNKALMIDLVKNSFDLLIPATALGFVKFSPGAIGFFGTLSSMAVLYTMFNPIYKLGP